VRPAANFLILIVAGALTAPAHDVITTKLTWSAEISRIVYRRCAACHRQGGTAPMPLITFQESRPWAKAIRDEVLGRRMPPWGAVKGYGALKDDRGLTQDEITRIAQWVEGGAPEGEPKYLPPIPPPEPTPLPAVGIRTRSIPPGRTLTGIRPVSDVGNAKIFLLSPDGSRQPLLWLHEYKQKWNRTFLLQNPVKLPTGSRVVAEPTIPLEFLTRP